MGISKVILNGVVKVDLTQDTVDETNLLAGETATGADGEAVEGAIASKASADLTVIGATVTAPAGFYSAAASKSVATTTHPNPTASINSTTGVVTASHTQGTGYVTGGTTTGTLNLTTQAAKTVTPTESEQTAVAAGRYTTGAVKVGAISSTYIGSDIAQNDSDDLTASGATITAPAGYYAAAASKAVASGTAGTPTATKGTVSNHSVSVTPSVTNTTGYITGGTKSGTAVTVSVAELESGTKSITENGTGISVSGYSTVDVNVPSSGGVTVNPLSVTQNGTYTAPSGTAYSPVTVNVEGGGGGSTSAPLKDVNFWDYDGTILYSYTASEFENISALPANPTHAGLIAQGWNWTLEEINSQLSNVGGTVNVGQLYTTTSGKTEFDVLVNEGRYVKLNVYMRAGDAELDWGDGSPIETISGSVLQEHTYQQSGFYTISINLSEDATMYIGSDATTRRLIFNNISASGNTGYYGANGLLKAARIGRGVTFGRYAFSYCTTMEYITIPASATFEYTNSTFMECYALKTLILPKGITAITDAVSKCSQLRAVAMPLGAMTTFNTQYAFRDCVSMTSVTLQSGITIIASYAFVANASLKSIILPDTVTTINTSAFQYCSSLKSIIIPDGVTSIGANAFNYCRNMEEFHFLPTTPPTLANKNAFTNVTSTCVFYVPAASLEAYQTATNWSTYASQMVGE